VVTLLFMMHLMFKNSETTNMPLGGTCLGGGDMGALVHAHRRVKSVLLKIASDFVTLGYVFFNYCSKVPKKLLLLLPYFESRISEAKSKLYHQTMKCNKHIYLPV
jgi:hypothetical protein